MKSGEFLLKFFADTGSAEFRFADVTAAMTNVDRILRNAANTGDSEARTALPLLDDLWNVIVKNAYGSSVSEFKSRESIDNSLQLILHMADRLSVDPDACSDETQRDNIQNLVDAIPSLLAELEVPEKLKEYILQLTNEVRYSLDQFETTGGFRIQDAFARLQASLNVLLVSVGNEKDHTKVSNFVKEKWIPCITAVTLLFGVPTAALGARTSFQELTSGSSSSSVEVDTHPDGGNPISVDR